MPEKILGNLRVKDISNLIVRNPTTVRGDCSLDELLVKILEDKRTRHAYVVDEKGRLLGSIRLSNLVARLFPYGTIADRGDAIILNFRPLFDANTVEEFMNEDPRSVDEETPITEVATIMAGEKMSELPVVDDKKHVIGEVNILEIVTGYLRAKGVEFST